MKVSLVKEMREIDRKAVDEYGISELVLMENAGHRTMEAVEDLLGSLSEKNVCVLAGSGNNGGDAFVAARHLANAGAKVKVFFIGNPHGKPGQIIFVFRIKSGHLRSLSSDQCSAGLRASFRHAGYELRLRRPAL